MTPKAPLKNTPEPFNGSDETTASEFPSRLDREIAARLQQAREKQALSQEEIAARIGIPIEIYAQLESAKRRVDAWHLSKLAMAFDLPISWFFGQTSQDQRGDQRARMIVPGALRHSYSDSDTRIEDLRQRLYDIRTKRKPD